MKMMIKFVLFVLAAISAFDTFAQNGIVYDKTSDFLAPMMKNERIYGHAYLYFLDKTSKDSSSYILSIFDSDLKGVGEKKFYVRHNDQDFGFVCFNGKNFVVYFKGRAGKDDRYIFFDTSAKITKDTLLQKDKYYNGLSVGQPSYRHSEVSMLSDNRLLQYELFASKHKKEVMLTKLKEDNYSWSSSILCEGGELQEAYYLGSSNNYALSAILYKPFVKTNVDRLASRVTLHNVNNGMQMFQVDVPVDNPNMTVYPLRAAFKESSIELISQFTLRDNKFSKTFYGVCTHQFSYDGKLIKANYNEFTVSLLKDSLVKKFRLLENSYVYFHKAIQLPNNNWLLAGEQYRKYGIKKYMLKSQRPEAYYKKESLWFFEIDAQGAVVNKYAIKNKTSYVSMPLKEYRDVQLSSMKLDMRGANNIGFYVRDADFRKDAIAFVYVNRAAGSRSVNIGNVIYENGEFSQDNYVLKANGKYSMYYFLPSRFRHLYIFKINDKRQQIDFEYLKFNN